ncbi:MAG: VOC family protein [Acidobacteriota bacterium]|nr:VOC family protein [Acidobacteriota bacterium]
MAGSAAGLFSLHHQGIIVRDLDAAMEGYRAVFGIQFSEFEANETNSSFTGASDNFSVRFGVGLLGLAFIELIQPSSGTSIYSSWLQEHGPGLHHLAFSVGDIAAARRRLESRGYRSLLDGTINGLAQLSYYGAPDLGCIIEPIQFSAALPAFLLKNAKPFCG